VDVSEWSSITPGILAGSQPAPAVYHRHVAARRLIAFVIYGTFMRDQPGHAHLSGARFVEAVRTAPRYRLYDVGGLPALVEAEHGVAIACELYEVSEQHAVRLAGLEPPGWERRPIELSDGRAAEAFLGPARGVDVSSHGGWAAYRGT
jgi:gamma-glutamylcyclotransferase (GGCT)/AIG2-like uncharacterized protein YtfP